MLYIDACTETCSVNNLSRKLEPPTSRRPMVTFKTSICLSTACQTHLETFDQNSKCLRATSSLEEIVSATKQNVGKCLCATDFLETNVSAQQCVRDEMSLCKKPSGTKNVSAPKCVRDEMSLCKNLSGNKCLCTQTG